MTGAHSARVSLKFRTVEGGGATARCRIPNRALPYTNRTCDRGQNGLNIVNSSPSLQPQFMAIRSMVILVYLDNYVANFLKFSDMRLKFPRFVSALVTVNDFDSSDRQVK